MSIDTLKNQSSSFNLQSYFKSLIQLMKPRVMSLVIFTCAVGLLTAPNTIPVFDALISIFFVTIGAGAAGALNMWYEADLDKLMTRTCLRPIPTGKINRDHALIFGIALSFVSIYGLYYFSNFLSALLLFVTIAFYVFVYTIWLKRKTPQNIVIGGASGALPPVIGWTIATNSLTFEPITFFLIIFYWTPSHFWALSLYKAEDYQKAKIPMLPITNGIEETKKKIFIYSLFMLPIIFVPYVIGFVGDVFLATSLLLTLYYNFVCYDLFKYKKNAFDIKKAKKVFGYSILYLFLIFVLFLIDSLI
ncbi:MAG: heme o synthase [Candidatus Pelagibacter sp.]